MDVFSELALLPDMPPDCHWPNFYELSQIGCEAGETQIGSKRIGRALEDIYPSQLGKVLPTKAKPVQRSASVRPAAASSKPTPRPRGAAAGRASAGPAAFAGLADMFKAGQEQVQAPQICKSLSLPLPPSNDESGDMGAPMEIDDDDDDRGELYMQALRVGFLTSTDVRGRSSRAAKAPDAQGAAKKPAAKPTPRPVSTAPIGKGKGRQPNTPQRSPSPECFDETGA